MFDRLGRSTFRDSADHRSLRQKCLQFISRLQLRDAADQFTRGMASRERVTALQHLQRTERREISGQTGEILPSSIDDLPHRSPGAKVVFVKLPGEVMQPFLWSGQAAAYREVIEQRASVRGLSSQRMHQPLLQPR